MKNLNFKKAYNGLVGIQKVSPFVKYLESLNRENLVGVEIGVRAGDNAYNLLSRLSISKLFLIDPYSPYRDTKTFYDKEMQLKYYNMAKKKLRCFDNKVFIIKRSTQAVDYIPDNLDFVYVDGDHSYDMVRVDLENYWSKIKKGGVLGGDDYDGEHYYGVVHAVNEFVYRRGLKFQGGKSDWWVVKE